MDKTGRFRCGRCEKNLQKFRSQLFRSENELTDGRKHVLMQKSRTVIH